MDTKILEELRGQVGRPENWFAENGIQQMH
jgi:hypothetical protein